MDKKCCFSPQQEAADCEPLDELYDALAEVVGAEETAECYKSYLLVLNTHRSLNYNQALCIFSLKERAV